MLMALLLAASCADGSLEGRHSDVIAAKPKRAAGCWAQLDTLARKGWSAAGAETADKDLLPCLGEARDALAKFKDEGALREWLQGNGLAQGLPKDARVVSVRHALYFTGNVVEVALAQSADPPLRPVDGMTVIAALAPELKGARLLDTMPKVPACHAGQKSACTEDCHPVVALMISLKDRCLTLDVKALNCSEESMSPYVFEQVRLLNQALEGSASRFAGVEGGAVVVHGPKAGLQAARDAELLRVDDTGR
jgi:hypothetical protein